MTIRLRLTLLSAFALWLALAGRGAADEIRFLNGDRLSGTIVGAAGGKLTIKTDAAGEVTVDLARVRTFSTDEPILLRIGDTLLRSRVTDGPDGTIRVTPAPGDPAQVVPLTTVTQINPPRPRWRGAITVNGLLTRGNAETASLGASLRAARRAEHDRITLEAGYSFGRETTRDTGEAATTVDNAFALGKYDYFLSRRLYVLAALRAERDRIADLDLRLTPSIGLGYQWYETPTFNLATEAGLAWVYEDLRDQDSQDHVAARLAYRVDWKPHRAVTLFHSLEWLPRVVDVFGDYNVNGDAGVRATIVGGFFSELKVEARYDSTPAAGAENEDLRYLFGLGWSF